MDRTQILRSWLNRDALGLEIGPLHAPVAPKSEGWQVETIDHADTATLRARYQNSPDMDASAIQEVDYVSGGRSMLDVIGTRGRYDWIIASHVAEHVPDLLGFLLECQALLKPSGRLVLALPDKRQCFDALRPVSTSGDVLQAHLELRQRHAPGAGFDYVARAVEVGGRHAWGDQHAGAVRLQHSLEGGHALFNALATTKEYHDLHGWVFVPSSLRLLVEELYQLDLCGLRETAIHPTMGIEFFVALSCAGSGPGVSRQDLVLQAAAEELAGLESLLPTKVRPQADAMEERAKAAEARVSALESSMSWRVTTPLRRVAQVTRHLIGICSTIAS
jgi:SAM-dependent methyltransferase